MNYKELVQQRVDEVHPRLVKLAKYIYANPEYGFEEFKACAAVSELLTELGFAVETGVGGIETSVRAVYDSGKPGPNFGFVGEYDAFPGMGHSCGHNLMTPIAIGAAYGMMPLVDELGGKLTVIGAPAEEGGGGKVILLENGVFDGLDTAICIHSSSETTVQDISYSRTDLFVDFYGKASHAATWPEEGVSALVPVIELFNTIHALRLEMSAKGKILGIITKGGDSPIMIPDHCQAKFTVRSFSMKDKWELHERLLSICRHIAEITGTRFEYHPHDYTYEDIRNNEALEALLGANFTAIGEDVQPRKTEQGVGCTDMGNVSHAVPALHSYVKVAPAGARVHTKEFELACGTPEAHKAIGQAAKAVAMTGADLLTIPGAMDKVRQAFAAMKAKYE